MIEPLEQGVKYEICKDTRTTSSSVSIVNFEQVNAGWEMWTDFTFWVDIVEPEHVCLNEFVLLIFKKPGI